MKAREANKGTTRQISFVFLTDVMPGFHLKPTAAPAEVASQVYQSVIDTDRFTKVEQRWRSLHQAIWIRRLVTASTTLGLEGSLDDSVADFEDDYE